MSRARSTDRRRRRRLPSDDILAVNDHARDRVRTRIVGDLVKPRGLPARVYSAANPAPIAGRGLALKCEAP